MEDQKQDIELTLHDMTMDELIRIAFTWEARYRELEHRYNQLLERIENVNSQEEVEA